MIVHHRCRLSHIEILIGKKETDSWKILCLLSFTSLRAVNRGVCWWDDLGVSQDLGRRTVVRRFEHSLCIPQDTKFFLSAMYWKEGIRCTITLTSYIPNAKRQNKFDAIGFVPASSTMREDLIALRFLAC
jgi:hypothetical protein